MEVAGGWRHQWTGAAEYGKMVDGLGGVTRMARALEVRTSSAPGARVRVTKAAFHSTGPLSTSFVFHSSKRTILSSRVESEDLVSPSLVWKPQEISSIPLDAASDSCAEGDEPYKVTEPDDNDISEPSKWRTSQAISEESSSADTASLVDASARLASDRPTDSSKTSTASSQSIKEEEPKSFRSSFRRKPTSEPLMKISEHAKCLESSKLLSKPKDEWHDRRNSYGFENSTISGLRSLGEDDKVGMESSTDSGICKSSEIVDIPIKHYFTRDTDYKNKESQDEESTESFQDWLAKNRSLNAPRPDYPSLGKSTRDDGFINLKPLRKNSTLTKYDSSDDDKCYNDKTTEGSERKQKKVGFCKTELHVAAESGIINIIETDEKPPPKHDFRRRRSPFVSMYNEKDKPITLFGGTYLRENENTDLEQICFGDETLNNNDRQFNEHENDLNVKSILKNKIPTPKPYLLGEDMDFDKGLDSNENIWGVRLRRTSDEYLNGNLIKSPISILNESLKQDNILKSRHIKEIDHNLTQDNYSDRFGEREHKSNPAEYFNHTDLPVKSSSEKSAASTQTPDEFIYSCDKNKKTNSYENKETSTEDYNIPIECTNSANFINEKLKLLQLSPIMQNRARTRQLGQNELKYFGVKTEPEIKETRIKVVVEEDREKTVKPMNRPKKYEQPIYQNIPIRPVPIPIPAPRSTKETNKKTNVKNVTQEKNVVSQNSPDDDSFYKDNTRKLIEELTTKDKKNKNSYRIIVENKQNDPATITIVETPPRITIDNIKNNESVVPTRKVSVESIGLATRKSHRSNEKDKHDRSHKHSDRKYNTPTEERIKYTEVEKNNSSIRRSPIKDNSSVHKSKTRSSSVDSSKIKTSKHSDEKRHRSVDRRSHEEKENHNYTASKEKCPKIVEEYSNKPSKSRSSHASHSGTVKDKARKREYVIDYNDNHAGYSGSRHHSSSAKRENQTKSQTKPKEVTRTSRVATVEMKTPMIMKEARHRTKSADPTRSRKKQREESLK